MKRLAVLLAAVAVLAMGATSGIQCNVPDIVVVAPSVKVVTIDYINDADADVAVTLLSLGDDNKDAGDLQDDGRETYTLVPQGQTQTVVLDCDGAGSLMIDKAKLLLVADFGPSAGTDALHMGDDYDCGDAITVEMFNNPSLTELHLDVFRD